jgi:DNA modification methylase
MPKWKVAEGDSLAVLKGAPDNFFDAMCTDPPAGISMMGREWDSDKGGRDQWVAWLKDVMAEAMRCLKPGAHCLVWALPRTSHWTATALEDAGFEVRDCITHHFGSGFPKSADISKSIDKMAGAERKVLATIPDRWAGKGTTYERANEAPKESVNITSPATTEAKTWDGWGTALKPATEHWILCRKPLAASSIARNVLTHGTGALNIAGTRVNRATDDVPGWHKSGANGAAGYNGTDTFAIREMSPEEIQERCSGGRWPPNLLLSHSPDCADECAADCPVAELDRQSGVRTSGRTPPKPHQGGGGYEGGWRGASTVCHGDSGGASRFFPTFRQERLCELCSSPVNGADTSSALRNELDAFVPTPAQSSSLVGSGDSNQSRGMSVSSAGASSGSTPPAEESIVVENVPLLEADLLARRVKCAASLCARCGTTIARLLVERKLDLDRGLPVGLLSIPEPKRRILIRCLVMFVESLAPNGTIPTTQSLMLLFGFVRDAITGLTQADEGDSEIGPPKWLYKAKPSRSEKEAGLESLPESTLNRVNSGGLENEERWKPVQVKNNHPTPKGIELCRWLCRLITPPGGAVIDPFMGSGSIGCAALLEGFDFFGIEQDPHYCEIARARLAHWAAQK